MNIDEQLDSILAKYTKAQVCDDAEGNRLSESEIQFEYLSTAANVRKAKSALKKLIIEARIEENQYYLNSIKAFNERGIERGEVYAASFESAGAVIVEGMYKHAFEDRINSLKEGRE